MNAREYFDLLVKTSKEGRFPSLNEQGEPECCYRGMDDRNCPVGLIMPDDCWSKNFEGNEIPSIWEDEWDWLPEGMELKDLQVIQGIHDYRCVDNWNHNEFVKQLQGLSCFAGMGE